MVCLGSCFHRMGTQDIPGLRAAGPNIPFRSKPTRIIEAAGSNSQHFGTGGARSEQGRSAFLAEPAAYGAAAVCGTFPISRLATHKPKRCLGNNYGRRVGGATGSLAVTAVTIEHCNRSCRTIVAHRPARTAARENRWYCH